MIRNALLFGSALLTLASVAQAHEFKAKPSADAPATFDIRAVSAKLNGTIATFAMTLAETAGTQVPQATGKLPGAGVLAYVWPLDLDPSSVGFAEKSGTLALAVTAHPDFDDTPLFDENGDGDPANDGKGWHSHWVVLAPDDACAGTKLKVRDILPGEDLALPMTAPGLPLLLDSPGYSPLLSGTSISLNVPLPAEKATGAGFDGITAALQVNSEGKTPLLCVTSVYDIASGDLSLPGKID